VGLTPHEHRRTPANIVRGYFCHADKRASVFVYHPQQSESTATLRGTLALRRGTP